MHPTDHISIAGEYFLYPNSNSGARYHNVTTTGVYFLIGLLNYLARPKSHSFKVPLLLNRILEVLRSL